MKRFLTALVVVCFAANFGLAQDKKLSHDEFNLVKKVEKIDKEVDALKKQVEELNKKFEKAIAEKATKAVEVKPVSKPVATEAKPDLITSDGRRIRWDGKDYVFADAVTYPFPAQGNCPNGRCPNAR